MNEIPFFDYRPGLTGLRGEIDAALGRVLDSGTLVLGSEVRSFEQEFALRCGTSHGVGVASGTDALLLSLRALGIGTGDEVITVANAGVPPVAAIRASGATPRLVDVDDATLLLDPERLEGALTERTVAVIPVHLYGQAAPLDPVLAFAQRHRLRVIEDCAQAHGASYRDRPVGSLGDVGCFSFYPTKNLGALGDAGFVATRNPELADRLIELRMYGYRGDRQAHREGLNSRLDELQAAVLRVKLAHFDAALAERKALAERYEAALDPALHRVVFENPDSRHAHHLLVVRCRNRAASMAALDAAGIGHQVHYAPPVYRMEAYAFLRETSGALPVSERAAEEVLSLPLYPGLSMADVDRVCSVLNSVG
ncbi:DegT/DnrJ/EryC1/StrS family aminotransferase [Myxococcota bacterium]|nr:DegT/DnrJ/EryC1/StrS family aminotransferase [Myxococcota bacterium]